MTRDEKLVLSKINMAWGRAVHGMQKMEQSAQVRPQNSQEIFEISRDASGPIVKLNVRPVVFNLPERANRGCSNLYIVVQGWLAFEGEFTSESPLRTQSYGTNIGYFRVKSRQLEHVYGAHYDMDEEKFGHPVFHGQIGAQMDLAKAINKRFHLNLEVVQRMGNILGNVRTPSAQMDIFAVMIQICADHLVGEDSANEVRAAFADLRNASSFLIGAAHRLDYLNNVLPSSCYQSRHWYNSPKANISA